MSRRFSGRFGFIRLVFFIARNQGFGTWFCCGRTMAQTMYASSPGKPAENKEAQTQSKRTNVGSTSKYSASPPHTPQSFLSIIERYSFLLFILFQFFRSAFAERGLWAQKYTLFLYPERGKVFFFIVKICNPFLQHIEYQPLHF